MSVRFGSRLSAALAMMALLLSIACKSSPTSPDVFDIPALVSNDTFIGTGTEATDGRVLTVHYSGWLYSPTAALNKGAFFQTSVGSTPFSFTLGRGQVITGWDQGVRGMKVGGRRTLLIPSSLAYGRTGSGNIPPNSAIVFDIELLSVQ